MWLTLGLFDSQGFFALDRRWHEARLRFLPGLSPELIAQKTLETKSHLSVAYSGFIDSQGFFALDSGFFHFNLQIFAPNGFEIQFVVLGGLEPPTRCVRRFFWADSSCLPRVIVA